MPETGDMIREYMKDFPRVPREDGVDPQQTCGAESRPKSYIGTKVVQAVPMDKFEYEFQTLKAEKAHRNQSFNADGYKVTYEDNYVSWSPKEVFERCYRELSIGEKLLV